MVLACATLFILFIRSCVRLHRAVKEDGALGLLFAGTVLYPMSMPDVKSVDNLLALTDGEEKLYIKCESST